MTTTTVGWQAQIMETVSANEDQYAAVDVRTALLRPKPPVENGSEALYLAHLDPPTPNKRDRVDHEPMVEFRVHHPQHVVGSGRSAEQEQQPCAPQIWNCHQPIKESVVLS